MFGTGLQLGRGSRGGDDRFCNPAKARRNHHRAADQLRRAQSDVSSSHQQSSSSSWSSKPPPEPASNRSCSAGPAPSLSNLERFLHSITPSVPAQYFSKTTSNIRRPSDDELNRPYFVLGDLWESFKEWSAYGAGVPLILNDSDSVVQYYVPYLSGIQIYCDSSKLPSSKPRRPDEDSDSDFRDSSSDGSSDCETERRLKHLSLHSLSNDVSRRLSLRDQPISLQEDFSSDDGENVNPKPCLIFEYLERDSPYGRVPLADKILDLAFRVPELKTLRSCDLLSSSWISVAWYPIYRIPTGPTLKDLDACFLTYHYLSTPSGGMQNAQAPLLTLASETEGVSKMSLPVFGLASYKFKGSLWTPNGGNERKLANSLADHADSWLRIRKVSHPDFIFFSRR